MLFRITIATIVAVILSASVSHAQINSDIPQTETSDGGVGWTEGEIRFCNSCCNGEISDNTCCRDCDCCWEDQFCPSYSQMRSVGVPTTVVVEVMKSVGIAYERLSGTERGKAMRSVMSANVKRLLTIYSKNPALQRRTGLAMSRYWPHDMWTNTGPTAHKVTNAALRELRQILTEVANADKAEGGSDVSRSIENRVLPNLTRDLVGKPYHDAFECFIGAKDCS